MKVKDIVAAVESVLPERRPIHHHEYHFSKRECALAELFLCSQGRMSWLDKTKELLADACQVDHVILTSSGTAALHVALLAAGVKPGEEVLVPTLTFAGTAHAVSYCGAIPNFVDGALGLNAYKLRRYLERTTTGTPDRRGRLNIKTERVISALIVVDLLGFSADWTKLSDVANEFGLTVIEDAAQALGATLGNRPCGSFGKAAALSFNNNKIVTGCGGGAVLTNDEWIAAKAHQLATTGRINHAWKIQHDTIGYNYRMNELSAALIYSQLERLSNILEAKREILSKYEKVLDLVPILKASPWQGEPNYWLTTILSESKDDLLEALSKKQIYARELSTPLHSLPYYADCPHDNMSYAEHTFHRAVCLPSGVNLCPKFASFQAVEPTKLP